MSQSQNKRDETPKHIEVKIMVRQHTKFFALSSFSNLDLTDLTPSGVKFHSLLKTKRLIIPLWVLMVVEKTLEVPVRVEVGQGLVTGGKDIFIGGVGK
jgi:hypothetical protein